MAVGDMHTSKEKHIFYFDSVSLYELRLREKQSIFVLFMQKTLLPDMFSFQVIFLFYFMHGSEKLASFGFETRQNASVNMCDQILIPFSK